MAQIFSEISVLIDSHKINYVPQTRYSIEPTSETFSTYVSTNFGNFRIESRQNEYNLVDTANIALILR